MADAKIKISSEYDPKGVDQAKQGLQGFGGVAGEVFKGVASWDILKNVFAKVMEGIKGAMDSALQYGDAVDKVSDITGVSSAQASRWAIQAQHVGTSADTVANGMAILSKNMFSGSDAFEKFGIKTKNAAGEMLPLDAVMAQVRDKEAQLGEGAAATAMEMSLFGKSGKELHDFLTVSNEEMDRTVQMASDLGLVLDDLSKDKIEQTNRHLNDMKMVNEAIGIQLADKLLPYWIKIKGALLGYLETIEWVVDKSKAQEQSNLNIERSVLKKMKAEYDDGTLTKKNFNDQVAYFKETTKLSEKEINEILGKSEIKSGAIQKTTKEELAALQTISDKQKQHYDDKWAGIAMDTDFLKQSKAEQLSDEIKFYESVLQFATLSKKDHDALETEIKKKKKDYNQQMLDDTKDTASAMADAFIASASNTQSAWDNLAKKMTDTVVTNAFKPMASGLQSMLGGFGDIGTILSGGIGGVIGSVVGGFIGMLGTNARSVAEYTKDAYDEMVAKTNRKLEDIGKERTETQKRLDLLEMLKGSTGAMDASGKFAKTSAADFLGVSGMTYDAARNMLFSTLQTKTDAILATRRQTISDAEAEIVAAQKREQELRNSAGDYWLHMDTYWNELNKALGRQEAAKKIIADQQAAMFETTADIIQTSLDIDEKKQAREKEIADAKAKADADAAAKAKEAADAKAKADREAADAAEAAAAAEKKAADEKAKAAVVAFNSAQDEIEYNFRMDKITKQEKLSGLKGLTAPTTDLARALALEIHNLEKDIAADVIPSAATGGFVKKGGLVNIHEGEMITPKGQGGGITINVGEGAFVANGVNWSNEGEKRTVAKEMASTILAIVNGGLRTSNSAERKI